MTSIKSAAVPKIYYVSPVSAKEDLPSLESLLNTVPKDITHVYAVDLSRAPSLAVYIFVHGVWSEDSILLEGAELTVKLQTEVPFIRLDGTASKNTKILLTHENGQVVAKEVAISLRGQSKYFTHIDELAFYDTERIVSSSDELTPV